jgi:hypothetical protein
MSPHGHISTIFKATVTIPDDVWVRFGHTKEFENVGLAASAYVEVSGQNAYAEVTEWGEAPTLRQCEDFINHWHNWILQWEAAIRESP